jgi:hypothetical protein
MALLIGLLGALWAYVAVARHQERAARSRAIALLRSDPDLERALTDAVDALPTVERWKAYHLACGDPERLRIIDGVVADLADRGDITPEQAELALTATRVAGGTR